MSEALKDLPVAILAGGLATRLRPLTEKIPKVLVPVANKPFLSHQLALLKAQGIKRAVLCLGYLGELVVEEFGNGQSHGIELEYSFMVHSSWELGPRFSKRFPYWGSSFLCFMEIPTFLSRWLPSPSILPREMLWD